jgi:hypothetical protein
MQLWIEGEIAATCGGRLRASPGGAIGVMSELVYVSQLRSQSIDDAAFNIRHTQSHRATGIEGEVLEAAACMKATHGLIERMR